MLNEATKYLAERALKLICLTDSRESGPITGPLTTTSQRISSLLASLDEIYTDRSSDTDDTDDTDSLLEQLGNSIVHFSSDDDSEISVSTTVLLSRADDCLFEKSASNQFTSSRYQTYARPSSFYSLPTRQTDYLDGDSTLNLSKPSISTETDPFEVNYRDSFPRLQSKETNLYSVEPRLCCPDSPPFFSPNFTSTATRKSVSGAVPRFKDSPMNAPRTISSRRDGNSLFGEELVATPKQLSTLDSRQVKCSQCRLHVEFTASLGTICWKHFRISLLVL